LRPTKLLIFGDPKAGTPIMLAAPDAALDLPLKILVAEDSVGKVWISYNSPVYLQTRHGFPRNYCTTSRRRSVGAKGGGMIGHTKLASTAGCVKSVHYRAVTARER